MVYLIPLLITLALFTMQSCHNLPINPSIRFPDDRSIFYSFDIESRFRTSLKTFSPDIEIPDELLEILSAEMHLHLNGYLSAHLNMVKSDGSSILKLDFLEPTMRFMRGEGGWSPMHEGIRVISHGAIFLRFFESGEILDIYGLRFIGGAGRSGEFIFPIFDHLLVHFPIRPLEEKRGERREIKIPLKLTEKSGILVRKETVFELTGESMREKEEPSCMIVEYRSDYTEEGKYPYGKAKAVIDGKGSEDGRLCYSKRHLLIIRNESQKKGRRHLIAYDREGMARGEILLDEETSVSLTYLPTFDHADTEDSQRQKKVDSDETLEKRIGADEILRVIHDSIPRISTCYFKEEEAGRDTFGEVYLNWTIDPSGRVSAPVIGKSTVENALLESCLIEEVSKIRFPPMEYPIRVSYPFIYREGRLMQYPLLLTADPSLRFPFIFIPPDIGEANLTLLERLLFGEEAI